MSEQHQKPFVPFNVVVPAIVILIAASVLFGAVVGSEMRSHSIREEAVKVGVAEWVADSNGKPKFVWITDRSER